MSATIPSFTHADITCDARGIFTLQITHAKSLNILATPVTLDLIKALHWLAQCEHARAVVIRGSGDRAFIGGANIYEMAELNPQTAREFITNLRELCDAVMNIPVPTIARIAGFCLGAGLELAAACDIRLASDDAQFGMPEVRVGIPSVIHAVLLPRLIGPGASNWLLLTGEMVDCAQALAWGFVQFNGPLHTLDELVERSVSAISASGPFAIRSQKALLRYWSTSTVEAGLDRSVHAFADAFNSDEPRAYMTPFVTRKQTSGAL